MTPDKIENIMSRVCSLWSMAYRVGKRGSSGADLDAEYTELKLQEHQIRKILEKET